MFGPLSSSGLGSSYYVIHISSCIIICFDVFWLPWCRVAKLVFVIFVSAMVAGYINWKVRLCCCTASVELTPDGKWQLACHQFSKPGRACNLDQYLYIYFPSPKCTLPQSCKLIYCKHIVNFANMYLKAYAWQPHAGQAILAPCWPYVGPMLAYVGPMLAHVEPSWELCWGHVWAIYDETILRCQFFRPGPPPGAQNHVKTDVL